MYDLIVLGGGPAGYTGAIAAAHEGLTVLLAEREKIGGVCLNKGCIPTKSLLKSAEIYYQSLNSDIFGVKCGNVAYSTDEIFKRKDEVVFKLTTGIEKLVEKAGVEFVAGEAVFVNSNTVSIAGEKYSAKHIMLATGGRAAMPPIVGAERALTSDEVLKNEVKGDKIVIIGGGVIGVEFATFFKKLGKSVTIIEIADRILPLFERDISLNLAMCLKKLGVSLQVGAAVSEIGEHDVKYEQRGKSFEIVYDSVIVCTGRRAEVDRLGLENTKVKFDKTGVYADEYCRTADECIFAVGDVVAKNIQLAHNAAAEAETVVHNLVNGTETPKPVFIPSCVYTSPEVATVGLSEAEAVARGFEIDVGKVPMGACGKAVLDNEDRGFVKVVFNKNNEKLLGVSLLSEHATDIIGAVGTLVANGAERSKIVNSVYPHPTICESFYEAVADSMNKAIHIIKK